MPSSRKTYRERVAGNRSPMKCPKCGDAMTSSPAQVRIFGKVWIQRVGSVYCAPCGKGQLTKAGQEKLARAIEMTREVLGIPKGSPEPLIQFRDKDGTIFQVEVKSGRG